MRVKVTESAGEPAKRLRPRSAVTSGRKMFVDGDPNSAWARRYYDLIGSHVADLGGKELLSEAQLSLVRRATAIEVELEQKEARLSRGEPVDLDVFTRSASHLRRIFETIGLARVPREVVPTVDRYLAGEGKVAPP